MSGFLIPLFHLSVLLFYGYGIKVYLYGLVPPKFIQLAANMTGGPFKYLTFINMLLQCGYFILALLNDIIGSSTTDYRKQTSLQRVRDFIFSTVVFSLGSFVTISFWSLYNINRNLIFPAVFDAWFPNWLNHNVHTTPLVGVLIELYLVPHNFPRRKTGLGVVAFVCLLYLIWVCYIAYQSGHWVYPILAQLSMGGRALFISAMSVLISLFYILGESLNKRIWGVQGKEKPSTKVN